MPRRTNKPISYSQKSKGSVEDIITDKAAFMLMQQMSQQQPTKTKTRSQEPLPVGGRMATESRRTLPGPTDIRGSVPLPTTPPIAALPQTGETTIGQKGIPAGPQQLSFGDVVKAGAKGIQSLPPVSGLAIQGQIAGRAYEGITTEQPTMNDLVRRTEQTGVLDLDRQLAMFDQQSQEFFDRAREAFSTGLAFEAGRATGTQTRALEQDLANRGISFSGQGIAGNIAIRRAATDAQVAALANFDQKILSQIATARINLTLGHFDFIRQLELLETSGDIQAEIARFQAQAQQDAAEAQAWGQVFSGATSFLPFLFV